MLKRAAKNLGNGTWYSPKNGASGSQCASLAIRDAAMGEESLQAHRMLLNVLGHPTANPISARHLIYDWNDAKGQTRENVILALKLAALHAELDEQEEEKRKTLAAENAWALVPR